MARPDGGASPARAPSRAARLVLSLERGAARPWFLPAVSVFPLSDYVLPFLPNQMLLLGLSVVLPRRWWQLALAFVVATALGAALTAAAIQMLGAPLLDRVFDGGPSAGAIADMRALVQRHGLWVLAALAMLPWPPRAAVIACAVAGLPPLSIGAAVAAGRVLPAFGFTALGAFAPGALRRWAPARRVLDELATHRGRVTGGGP